MYFLPYHILYFIKCTSHKPLLTEELVKVEVVAARQNEFFIERAEFLITIKKSNLLRVHCIVPGVSQCEHREVH